MTKTPIINDEDMTDEVRSELGLEEENPVEIEIGEEPEIEIVEEDEAAPVEEAPKAEDPPVEEPEPLAETQKEEKKPSRANQRIRELVEQKNKTKAELEAERKEKEDLAKQLQESRIELAKSKVKEFDSAISAQKAKIIQARDAGETETELEAQEALTQLVTSKAQVELAIKEAEQEKPVTKPAAKEEPEDIVLNDAVSDWLDKNPWFKTDQQQIKKASRLEKLKMSVAIDITEALSNEGELAEDSAEFYAELDRRIGEELATMGIGTVQSRQEQSEAEDVKEPVKAPSAESSTEVKAVQQKKSTSPVSSGMPADGGAPNKQRVVLTPRDREIADQLGLSYKEYAEAKLKEQRR